MFRNKYWQSILIFFSFLIMVVACSESSRSPKSGREVFRTYCVVCHGAKGNLGMNGAKDLTNSSLTLQERIHIITNGRKTMQSFEKTLTKEEIAKVAVYTMTLKEL